MFYDDDDLFLAPSPGVLRIGMLVFWLSVCGACLIINCYCFSYMLIAFSIKYFISSPPSCFAVSVADVFACSALFSLSRAGISYCQVQTTRAFPCYKQNSELLVRQVESMRRNVRFISRRHQMSTPSQAAQVERGSFQLHSFHAVHPTSAEADAPTPSHARSKAPLRTDGVNFNFNLSKMRHPSRLSPKNFLESIQEEKTLSESEEVWM